MVLSDVNLYLHVLLIRLALSTMNEMYTKHVLFAIYF